MKNLLFFAAVFLATALHAAELLQDIVPPKPISTKTPIYSPEARRAGQQGIVVLKLKIRRDGTVEQVEIEKSSESKLLDDATTSAAREWIFSPARTKNGDAVEGSIRIPVRFALDI